MAEIGLVDCDNYFIVLLGGSFLALVGDKCFLALFSMMTPMTDKRFASLTRYNSTLQITTLDQDYTSLDRSLVHKKRVREPFLGLSTALTTTRQLGATF